ncbi:MAG TPA: DUF2200 domain-containing protein [Erysipelotrichaceae bacterium]|nr:DUF2200 domain-containing protein [Erysipelotrichaceae bacterium]
MPPKIYSMSFAKIYPLLVQKVVRKGRLPEEADAVISLLTGYSSEEIHASCEANVDYSTFFANAPHYHEHADVLKGRVCNVRVETIEEPLMKQIRQLDLLIDLLAKGKSLEAITSLFGE